jgi:small subunit ribosomal protein S3
VGNKINPTGFRLGVNPNVKHRSRWYAGKSYVEWLREDLKVRDYINGGLSHAGIARIDIERKGDRLQVDIHTARPGIVIGRKGSEVDRIRDDLKKLTGKDNIQLNVLEIARPELEAPLVAQNIAEQLEGRVAFRRAMRRGMQTTMRAGALGVRIRVGGRLGGAEMSRSENYREGRVPLHTLRADIDYGFREAKTQMGRIGVKVWIYRGDVMPTREEREAEVAKARARAAATGEIIPAAKPRGGRGGAKAGPKGASARGAGRGLPAGAPEEVTSPEPVTEPLTKPEPTKPEPVTDPADLVIGTALPETEDALLEPSAPEAEVPATEPAVEAAAPDEADDEAVPDEAVPDEAVPDEAVPDEAVPDEAVPDEAVPDAPGEEKA